MGERRESREFEAAPGPDSRASSALAEIRSVISRVRERWRWVEIARGALLWAAAALGAALLVALLELALMPGLPARLVLFLLLLGTVSCGFAVGLARPALRRIRDEEVARRLEHACPEIGDSLIGAVQLARDRHAASAAFVAAAIVQARDRLLDARPAKAHALTRLGRCARVSLPVIAVAAAAFSIFPGPLGSALLQVALPFSFVPVQGRVRIVKVKPGDAAVRSGARVAVEVEIAPLEEPPASGRLFYRLKGGKELERDLVRVDRTHYSSLLTVQTDLSYRAEVGRTQSRAYGLKVLERPALRRVDLAIRYPRYTGRPPERREKAVGPELDIRALAGSVLTVTAVSKGPVRSVFMEMRGGDQVERKALDLAGGRHASGILQLDRPGRRRYAIRLEDEAGAEDLAAWHLLEVLPDEPPAVSFAAPARNLALKPGETVKLAVKASDDYRLESVKVRFRRNREGEARPLVSWREPASPTELAEAHAWRLEAGSFTVGDMVTYWAEARDAAGNRARSAVWEVKLVDPASRARERKRALEALLAAVREIASIQRRVLKETQKLPRGGPAAKEVLGGQLAVREKTLTACRMETVPDAGVKLVKVALARLGAGPMTRAAGLAEGLVRSPAAKPEGLITVQKEILRQLERLLGVLPRAIEAAGKEPEEAGESDLPDVAAEKLKELQEQLEKFIAEQRKVLSDTMDLAKMPVEDFTEEDKEKLDALAATEEKWEKFLKDARSDLSMLPKQDFSSPQLLKELIEIYSEVEMAKDALKKQAAEIAVPLEQAGLELAEELTTHIEKWLPDTPDRDKWSMEEPLGEYQTPMAELPEELEDIIGELMEEEEDFFEEMEDVTSSWADSLDKGAGWDTLDGPISNMSAQGVTGNRLPNASEIGGRSGEGRTGRASGEMVEDTATGKGGRRTPTRLTPDAFLGGEIKDLSKDPAGGATGGGKLSGAGEEGLEGPVPPDIKRRLERLKGAQASLRNKAERVGAQLKLKGYPAGDIDSTLRTLGRLGLDFKDGRYMNTPVYRRAVLAGFSRARRFVEGTAEIELDRSRVLGELEDEIGPGGDEIDPAGYEALIRAYRDTIRSGRMPVLDETTIREGAGDLVPEVLRSPGAAGPSR